MSDVGVVGGGIGGMMTALLLARKGLGVTLYERQSQLGGRLASESDKSDQAVQAVYRIDRGPTIVLLPQMIEQFLAEAGIASSAYEMKECNPMYRIHYSDGMVITKYRDTEQMAAELDRLFPGEGGGMHRYMADMAPAFAAGRTKFLERPFLRKRDFFTLDNMRLLGRLRVHLSARQLAGRYFKSGRAIDAFSLQTLYIGGLPSGSPSLYAFIPYAEHAFGIWYWRGGYHTLVPLLAERLQQAGVEVRVGKAGTVERILTEQGKAVGLIADEVRHAHRAVVFNGDFPHLAGLLPQARLGRPRTFKPSSGCILLYIGANRRWGGDEEQGNASPTDQSVITHQFFLPNDLEASLRETGARFRDAAAGWEGELPAYYVFNPVASDPEAAPPGHAVLYFLIPLPLSSGAVEQTTAQAFQQRAEELADRVLADADRRAFPGLLQALRWRKMRTPADGAAEGWYGGGSFGIAPTWGQSGLFRPQVKPYPIAGLYSVGASVHPGGGIPIVMQGANLAAQQLMKEWV